MALEMGVFALAAYFMGWIGAPAVAAHAVALQIAALTFMVPLGLGPGGNGARRAGARPRRRARRSPAPAGHRGCIGVGFMGAMALVMWAFPRQLVTLFLDDVPANAVVIALAVSFLARRRGVPAGRRRPGDRRRHAARTSRHALADAVRAVRLLGRRPRHRRVAGVRRRLARASASGSAWRAGLASVAALMLARWLLRDRLGLTRAAHYA